MALKIIPTKLKDVKLVETDVFGDNRGFFTETYTREKFVEAGITSFNEFFTRVGFRDEAAVVAEHPGFN